MEVFMNKCRCGCGKNTKKIWYVGHSNKGRKLTPEHKIKCARPMEKNGRWNGGKMIDKNGYILIKKREHPFSNNSGYIREHRLVMEQHIGRYLNPEEIVHHMNHNPSDNRIENLMLINNSSEHIKECRTGRKFPRKNGIWFICRRCGNNFYLANNFRNKNVRYCSWECRYSK